MAIFECIMDDDNPVGRAREAPRFGAAQRGLRMLTMGSGRGLITTRSGGPGRRRQGAAQRGLRILTKGRGRSMLCERPRRRSAPTYCGFEGDSPVLEGPGGAPVWWCRAPWCVNPRFLVQSSSSLLACDKPAPAVAVRPLTPTADRTRLERERAETRFADSSGSRRSWIAGARRRARPGGQRSGAQRSAAER